MKYYRNLIIRVSLAIFLGIFYKLYYIIFKPLTLYLSFVLLKMWDNSAMLVNDTIFTNTHTLTFIDACIAASAYLLLTLLILVTKGITFWKRVAMFVYGSLLILAFNIARIMLLFYCLFNYNYDTFTSIHMFIWKFLSTIFVFLVWIFLIKRFKVKAVPVYSDVKYLLKLIRKKA